MVRPVYCTVSREESRHGKGENIPLKNIRQDKTVLCVSLLAMVFSTLGLLAAAFIYMRGFTLTDVTTSSAVDPIACAVCAQLIYNSNSRKSPDPVISKLIKRVEKGVEMCCAHNSDQMSALLEVTMRRKESIPDTLPEFDPHDFTISSVSAHKRLYPPLTMTNLTVPQFEESSLVETHFNAVNDHLVEHIRGVDVLEDGLRILRSGQYIIYSNIHFRPDSAFPCSQFTFQTWGHYVMKYVPNHPGYSGCILKTVHTCCDKCTRADETSFASGVFYLNAGDIIRVTVSAHGLIYFNKQSSYLGLTIIDSAAPSN